MKVAQRVAWSVPQLVAGMGADWVAKLVDTKVFVLADWMVGS